MVMFAPRTMASRSEGAFSLMKITSAAVPGVNEVAVVPSVVQLLLALPSDCAHTLVPPLKPPFQVSLVRAVCGVTLTLTAVSLGVSKPSTVKFVVL